MISDDLVKRAEFFLGTNLISFLEVANVKDLADDFLLLLVANIQPPALLFDLILNVLAIQLIRL